MVAVLVGFVAIWAVVGVGWLLAHVRLLGADSLLMLSRLSFFVGSPALMVTMMARADLERLFSTNLVVTLCATLTTAAAYVLISRTIIREPGGGRPGLGHTVIGTLSSGYVNAANMGLPIASYVLHDVTWIAPLLLVQVGVLQPVALALLDLDEGRSGGHQPSLLRNLSLPFRNPMTLGVLAGLAVNLSRQTIPAVLLTPLTMLGGLAVPTMLIAFGVSLRLGPLPGRGPEAAETALVCALKLVVQPVVALVLARVAGLDATTTRAVVVLAGLPTAQNIFNHAVRYDREVTLARDAVFITSVGSILTLVGVATLFG